MYKCIDCKKEIDYRSKRCIKCSHKHLNQDKFSISKDFLNEKYFVKHKSMQKIADELKCSREVIKIRFKRFKLKARTLSKAKKGKYNHFFGKHHTNNTKIKIKNSYYHKHLKGKNNPMFGVHRFGKKAPTFGTKMPIEQKIKLSAWHKGKHLSKKTKLKISQTSKKRWGDKNFRNKTIIAQRKGMKLFPNKPEKILSKLLPYNFQYSGDGQIIISGFNPDFIDKKRKLIVEMFGDYWHNREDQKIKDRQKLAVYYKLGYKTLVIWEHELKQSKKVINKLIKFNLQEIK